MARGEKLTRLPGVTYAVSNTGPLISAFQSNSFAILTKVFGAIYLPTACVSELEEHGWEKDLDAAKNRLVILKLTRAEIKRRERDTQLLSFSKFSKWHWRIGE